MVYAGVFLIFGTALFIWRGYSSYLKSRTEVCREFAAALISIRDAIRSYMATPSEWARDYRSDFLESCGFLGYVRDGSGFDEAYKMCRDKLNTADGPDTVLSGLFRHFGDINADAQIEAISISAEKLEEMADAYSSDAEKKQKAAGAVIGALCAGIIIMVI